MRQYYLQQMGITPWVLREAKAYKKSFTDLAVSVSTCVRCPLHETRKQTVFGRGNLKASLMIVGDVPSVDEEQQGVPFAGKAGDLLNKMLSSIGFSKDDIYIANVLKCRIPENRAPNPDEIDQCCDYLMQQIAMVGPKLLLAVGRAAGQLLCKSTLALNDMRGQVHDYNGIPVIVSYHPEHLLCNLADKKNAYIDLLLLKQLMQACKLV
jgi:uracil-DNA glycosylase family 4